MNRLLALALCLGLAAPAIAADPPAALRRYTVREDVTYDTVNGQKLQLDIAVPAGPGPHPLVVCVHGGAWKIGHRKHLTRSFWWYDFGVEDRGLIEILAARGFAAATVSYRLAPAGKLTDQLRDVRSAIRFLRANADTFRIDPDRVAALGLSAGGHLAALVGTADDDPAGKGPSARVRCVVDYYGPADLRLYCESPGIERAFMVPLLGCPASEDPEVYRRASPIAHVTPDDPPFLILHGTADLIVPVIHSERLYDRLRTAGVPAELVKVPGAGHGWDGVDARATTGAVVKFLAEHLKGK